MWLKNSLLVLICALGIWIILPTFFPENDLFFKRKIKLGLDLQGGSSLVMKIDFDGYLSETMLSWRHDLQTKLQEKNYDNAIRFAEGKFLRIEGFDKKMLHDAKLDKVMDYFEILTEENAITLQPKFNYIKILKRDLLTDAISNIRNRVDGMGVNEVAIQQYADDKIIIQMPNVENPEEVKNIIGKTAKMTFHVVRDHRNIGSDDEWQYQFDQFQVKDKDEKHIYLLNKRVEMDGSVLKSAKASFTEQNRQPAVFFEFDAIGTSKFASLTKQNVGKMLAIVIDNQVVTAPAIQEAILSGRGMISGNFTMQEAHNLAVVLRAGVLPAKMEVVEEKLIGPTLGQEYIDKGVKSILISLSIVILIIVAIYKLFGVFAAIGLIMNIVFILAAMIWMRITLTLPGIAGMVLTIGMAVDSNILIFERIKEEIKGINLDLRAKSKAIERGFKNAIATILDANITTLLAALVLFICGVGPVRSFAITLIVGIGISLFTAVVLTRAMIECSIKKN